MNLYSLIKYHYKFESYNPDKQNYIGEQRYNNYITCSPIHKMLATIAIDPMINPDDPPLRGPQLLNCDYPVFPRPLYTFRQRYSAQRSPGSCCRRYIPVVGLSGSGGRRTLLVHNPVHPAPDQH